MGEADEEAGWWSTHWPLLGFPTLFTAGALLAAARIDGWSKDFNWWLVVFGAASLGIAMGTAIWNAIITRINAKATNELTENQRQLVESHQRVASLTKELAETARASAERDVAKPVIVWRTDYPYIRDAKTRTYRIRFWLANRGQRSTSIERLTLVSRTAKSKDPLLADSYKWPGTPYAFWPVDDWKGQGHFTIPPGTHRAFDVIHDLEPAEQKAMRERPPLLVVETVVGSCEPSVVGTGQLLDDDDPIVEAFLAEQEARYDAEYREYRRQQRRAPPIDEKTTP